MFTKSKGELVDVLREFSNHLAMSRYINTEQYIREKENQEEAGQKWIRKPEIFNFSWDYNNFDSTFNPFATRQISVIFYDEWPKMESVKVKVCSQDQNLTDISFQMVVRKAEESIGRTHQNFEIIAKNADPKRALSIINRYSPLSKYKETRTIYVHGISGEKQRQSYESTSKIVTWFQFQVSTVGVSGKTEAAIVCFDVICVSDTSGKLKKLYPEFENKLRAYLKNSITVTDPSKFKDIHIQREKRINDAIKNILTTVSWDIDIMDLPSVLSSDQVTLICEPVILRPQILILGNGTVSASLGQGFTQDGISASFKVRYRDHRDTLFIPMEVMLLKSIMSHTQKLQGGLKMAQSFAGQENIPQNGSLPLQPLQTPRNQSTSNIPPETPKGLAALKSMVAKTNPTPHSNPAATTLKSGAPKLMVVDLGIKNRELIDLLGGNEGKLRTKQLLGKEYQLIGAIERKGQGKNQLEIWVPFIKLGQGELNAKSKQERVRTDPPGSASKNQDPFSTKDKWVKFIPGMVEQVDSKEVAKRVRYLFYVGIE